MQRSEPTAGVVWKRERPIAEASIRAEELTPDDMIRPLDARTEPAAIAWAQRLLSLLAHDIPAFTVPEESAMADALAQLWQDPDLPALLQVIIDQSTPVFPKIAFGHSFTEMEPQALPIDMEET